MKEGGCKLLRKRGQNLPRCNKRDLSKSSDRNELAKNEAGINSLVRAITENFNSSTSENIRCYIWRNNDKSSKVLAVIISPSYKKSEAQ